MGTYDSLIATPVSSQPISVGAYGVPVRNAILDLDRRLSLREAAELLPANQSVYGNGINTMVGGANVWTAMPSFPAAVSITNPSTDFSLVCNVFFGAWMQTSAGDVRMGIALSGGVTVATPGPGTNQPTGWGLFPHTSSTTADQHMGFMQVTIPPGVAAVTFTAQGARSNATATVQINYPTVHVVPDRFTV
jgi:hypothetical protein